MKILIACEFSGIVRDAFIKRGHNAISCDLLPSERLGPHIQDDVLKHLNDGWDMVIAFPPCTHLACSGAAWFAEKIKDGRQKQGIDFFMEFTKLQCRWAIENPVGIMSKLYRKPDQIIQPYYFGNEAQKSTCLWLHKLYPLQSWKDDNLFFKKTYVDKGAFIIHKSGKRKPKWFADAFNLSPEDRAKVRSRTFQGIADAMAEQWG